ncbi:MAG TPA: flagellar basal-body MS-ring/collar protein FliF [Bryobacteraceae bacterium]|nr:flagellar basal-body MS-ring/collar protein FliF [Bryobacteraceae bacterium]
MDQFKRIFDTLSWKQMLSILALAGAVAAGLATFSHWNRERDYRPLYSELSPEDAAAVLAKVRESGSDFRLSDNGASVLVPSGKVAELRLQLAAAGVPKSGRIGFELFDKANFGASDFTEQVNYHRALEGELERSVMSLAEVEQARVHITLAKDSVFLESRQPAKASVLVKLRNGSQLSAQNVAAICQLTASAVEGLAPEAVSVVDTRGNLLNRARKSATDESGEPSEATLDYRQKVEHDVLAKVNGTLEPLLGADKFRATVSVDCDFTSAEQSEETFDPTKSVMVSSQKTEDISGGSAAGGVPGTPSNLPKPAARPTYGSTGVTRRTENITYQSSHTVRHVRMPQGTVKRMSVSLLVDSLVRFEGSGPKAKRIVEPPSPDKLKAIHDLVAGVIGFSAERGDQLVVETLPFETTLNPEQMPPAPPAVPTVAPSLLDQALKSKYLAAGAGVGIAILLTLIVLVFKLARRGAPAASVEMAPQLAAPAGDGESFSQKIENQLAEQAALRQKQETDALNALKLPPVTKKAEVLTKHIADHAKKDSTAMAHVLRSWMSDAKNK